MKKFIFFSGLLIILLLSGFVQKKSVVQTESDLLKIRVHGVQINVTDIDKAVIFYSKTLGFEVIKQTIQTVELKNDGIALNLNLVKNQREVLYNLETQTILVLQTNNLDSAMTEFKRKGVQFIRNKIENGVGYSAPLMDPFGNVISLLEQSKFPVPQFKEPIIYNVGYYLPDLELAKEFYCQKLGFKVRSTKYLPALPLSHQDSTFAFMLHERKVKQTKLNLDDVQTLIIFSSDNLSATSKLLKKNRVPIWLVPKKLPKEKDSYFFKDPFGNISKLIED